MAFEMKGLRQIMRVSWTAKKTNLWVLQQAGVERSLLQLIKERKLKYCGHVLRKQGESLKKDILEGTMPGSGVVTALRGRAQRGSCPPPTTPLAPPMRGWRRHRPPKASPTYNLFVRVDESFTTISLSSSSEVTVKVT